MALEGEVDVKSFRLNKKGSMEEFGPYLKVSLEWNYVEKYVSALSPIMVKLEVDGRFF